MSGASESAPPHRPDRTGVIEQLQGVWPGAKLTPLPRGRRDDAAAHRFLSLPSLDAPRLLVEVGPAAGQAAAVRAAVPGGGVRGAARAGLILAARSGLLPRLLPSFSVGPPPGPDVLAVIGEQLGTPVTAAMRVGPVRAVAKPVFQLLDPAGRTVGYCKLGTTPFTQQLVRTETEALRTLASLETRVLRVPRVLHGTRLGGIEVLVQEPLPAGGAPDAHLLTRAMLELQDVAGSAPEPVFASAWWGGLRADVAALDADAALPLVRAAVARVEAEHDGAVLQLGAWHTDWAPWNMSAGQGRVNVWDWEQFQLGVPVGFDAVHHALQQAVVVERTAPSSAVVTLREQAGALLAPFGVAAQHAPLVVDLYLLDLARRYLREGETGTRLARLGAWLPAAFPEVAP